MSVTWDPRFAPSYTPKEMLELGVFEGKYINDIKEVPKNWKKLDKVLGKDDAPDETLNHYGVKSRLPLSEWQERGWIDDVDPEGWFAWYIKYFLGRRITEIDERQIKRWKSYVARHQAQIKQNCKLNDPKCRPRQRQGLLQWAWDSSTEATPRQLSKNVTVAAKKAGVKVDSSRRVHEW